MLAHTHRLGASKEDWSRQQLRIHTKTSPWFHTLHRGHLAGKRTGRQSAEGRLSNRKLFPGRKWLHNTEPRHSVLSTHITRNKITMSHIVLLCYKALAVPNTNRYLSGALGSISRRYLRSATHGDLQVPRTRTVTYGPQSFAVSGPTIWNILPLTLRVSTTTLGQFQSGLKTMLFCLAYGTWLGAFVTF